MREDVAGLIVSLAHNFLSAECRTSFRVIRINTGIIDTVENIGFIGQLQGVRHDNHTTK